MKLTIPNLAHSSIFVIGDVMLDKYWFGDCSRISPEAPVPVVKVDESSTESKPGGAANVAINSAVLGAKVHLFGLVGDDEAGQSLTHLSEYHGVSCKFAKSSITPTTTKLRIMSQSQQLMRLDFEERITESDVGLLNQLINEQEFNCDVIVFSDYAKGMERVVTPIIQRAKQKSIPVLVDPKGIDFTKYTGATLLTPNMLEFEAVVGKVESEQDLKDKAIKLISSLNLEAILVTRSEAGMTLVKKCGTSLNLPTQAKQVFDVTGAGDSVIATLATMLGVGMTLEQACLAANAAAGVVVSKLGTSAVSFQELQQAVDVTKEPEFGVISLDALKLELQRHKAKGEKIVMTNGCFDILHLGHISYLKQAKALGDKLVVAVNDDKSVQKLKGTSRPINILEYRMKVLAALSYVDWVVAFSEDTPLTLIEEFEPDVLVKGGDYDIENIVGAEFVLANGGEVRALDFQNGFSTTSVIEKINESIPN
ncbi:TPA: bifunctional D-glycero-beta-D-manno-heptose-7-phosphate kinase/D-glycero-beta-D-manno-heptose 1-phosphate adenylyltransferase HldE [Vibrio cholerae]